MRLRKGRMNRRRRKLETENRMSWEREDRDARGKKLYRSSHKRFICRRRRHRCPYDV